MPNKAQSDHWPTDRKLGRLLRARLGAELATLYGQTLAEPLPPTLRQAVERLAGRDVADSSASKGAGAD